MPPAGGVSAVDVVVRHVGGMAFVGYGPSNHFLVMDGREPGSEGPQRAPGPMEVLLMALGGCTGMDVASILRKKRVPFSALELRLHGERASEHPKRYTAIDIEYVVRGRDLPRKAVEDAVRLSFEKYCSVAGTLRPGVELRYRVTLESDATEPGPDGARPQNDAGAQAGAGAQASTRAQADAEAQAATPAAEGAAQVTF